MGRLQKKRPAGPSLVEFVDTQTRRGPVVKEQVLPPSPLKRRASHSPSKLNSGNLTPNTGEDPGETPRKPKRMRAGQKGQNDFLREWLKHRNTYLREIIAAEAPPPGSGCFSCQSAPGIYQCRDCIGDQMYCTKCCLEQHSRIPYHRISKWNGTYFARSDLGSLGLVIHLGHSGDSCPSHNSPQANQCPLDSEDGGDEWEDDENGRGEWEDSGNGAGGKGKSSQWPAAPGTRSMVVVTSTGIVRRHIAFCRCPGHANPHLQLLKMKMFPASIHRPSTAFTFDVLDHFTIDAMECKTAALNFYNKLRRLTSNAFPGACPDRYRELMRVSRQWRNLQAMKRSGLGHESAHERSPGDLALFCPTCPQPGINVPPRSEWLEEERLLYRPSFVADGNFKLQHLAMRCPEDDVFLRDGQGHMVAREPYRTHLMKSSEHFQKSRCSNHRAVNNQNANGKNLDSTGIGGCACARHGAYVPHSMVDFQKGERQMNIDYAVCQTLNHIDGSESGLFIYDVCCQWIVNFRDRVAQSEFLSLWEGFRLTPAVGKFHLGAHIKECFHKYSLNFIKGAGQIDGEIMETLWSILDKVSGITRSMSWAHRQEILDDYMDDGNFKKLVKSADSLLGKWHRAIKGRETTRAAYLELNTRMDPAWIKTWTEQVERADDEGEEHLQIYNLNHEQEPSVADIRLRLAQAETQSGTVSGSVAWLAEGLNIEKSQVSLQRHISSLKHKPSAIEKAELLDRRRRLMLRIMSFRQRGSTFLNLDEEVRWLSDVSDESGDEGHSHYSDDSEAEEVPRNLPERHSLGLPSSLAAGELERLGLIDLARQEGELRRGQISEALEGLRMALGDKAYFYRTQVRNMKSQKTSLKAWGNVSRQDIMARQYRRAYEHARNALIRLNIDPDYLSTLHDITPEDMKMAGDVTEDNRIYQRSSTLAWFWRLGDDPAIDEVELNPRMMEFYRVNWMRAKARYNRWEEELNLVRHEMVWTVRYFQYRQREWEARGAGVENGGEGMRCYAAKQAALWKRFADTSTVKFLHTVPDLDISDQ